MISGEYFDAGSSLGTPATLNCQGNSLVLISTEFSRIVQPDTMVISERLAHLPRRLDFPDGSMFTTLQNEQLDKCLRSIGREPASNWINFFETGWRWTLLALVAIPTALYLLFSVGMPVVAAPMAKLVPESVKDDLDQGIIEFFDKNIFQPSNLEPKRQAELASSLSELSRFSPYQNMELIFRGGGFIGANAFALPGGTIIFTDEIVNMADQDGELVAVLAHEIGHVLSNHSMRIFMQSAGVSFVLGWMLGDLTMITDVVLVGGPVILQKMAYSRKFESEADAFGLMLLDYSGYSRNCFADMMEKLATQHDRDLDDDSGYLSSHPPPRDRIAMARSTQPCSEKRSSLGYKTPVPSQAGLGKPSKHMEPISIAPPEINQDPGLSDTGTIDESNRDYFPVTKVAPTYPRDALIQGIEGYCVVQYTVTRDGTVSEPRVWEDQCTSTLFIAPSLEAAMKFKYKPRLIDSQPVDVAGVENKFTYKIMTKPVSRE